MFIKVNHPNYGGVELVDHTLILHHKQNEPKILQDQVQGVAVSDKDENLHIVAFLKEDYGWYYIVRDVLEQQQLNWGQIYGSGGDLIVDGAGNSHLFYFAKQAVGLGGLLFHHIYTDELSSPLLVSSNAFSADTSFNVVYFAHYLHIAYCSSREQDLLYRVFDLKKGVWSGAVPFSKQSSKNPQFIVAGEDLYLFWLEESAGLQVRKKTENWSQAVQVSTANQNISQVGFSYNDGLWSVFWSEGFVFQQAFFDSWTERVSLKRELYSCESLLWGGYLIPFYQLISDPGQAKSEEKLISASVPEREKSEVRLETRLLEESFRVLQEWEKLKGEVKDWQKSFATPATPGADLEPLQQKCDRLERRLFKLQQNQARYKQCWEDDLKQIRLELHAYLNRLELLENVRKDSQIKSWKRLLNRE